jgi:hypothetical protein
MDKRHFTVVIGSKEHGLYVSSKPSSAAKKAVSKLCASNKSKKVEFSLREITQGSKKKTYGPYLGEMKKLKKPIELKGRVIRYDIKVHLKKGKSSTTKPSKKMRSWGGGISNNENDLPPVVVNNSTGCGNSINSMGSSAAVPSNGHGNQYNANIRLPKITNQLTIEEINTIVCAMIDFLIKEDILEYEPDYINSTNNSVVKGYTPWGDNKRTMLHYFRILFEDLKKIINNHLKINGSTLCESEMYYDKDKTLYGEINSVIDKIKIIPHKRSHTNRRKINDEQSKIKSLISTIIRVIKRIMECDNTTQDFYDQFDEYKQFKNFTKHIEATLLEKYYNVLSSCDNN